MTFHHLARRLESHAELPHALRGIAPAYLAEVRWLHLQFRTIRNRFVEHADRPWQRGTTAGVHGMDFTLFLPSPPGWLNDEQVNAEISALLRLAPKWLRESPAEYWEKARPRALLQRLVENVGHVETQADREHIASLVGKAGVTTPTFQHLGTKLADFACHATSSLLSSALEHPNEIQLGVPWNIGNDLFDQHSQ
jgi:hypothetical protein